MAGMAEASRKSRISVGFVAADRHRNMDRIQDPTAMHRICTPR